MEYDCVTRLPGRLVIETAGFRILAKPGYCHELDTRGRSKENLQHSMSTSFVESVVDLRGIDIALFGDIHKPYVDPDPKVFVIHPGSVGAPFDRTPGEAKYMICELVGDQVIVNPRAVPYSRDRAIQHVRRAYRVDPGEDSGYARFLAGGTRDHDWEPVIDKVK